MLETKLLIIKSYSTIKDKFLLSFYRRSLPLDALKLGPEEGIIIAFVPDFDHKGDMDIVEAETAQE